MGRNGCGKSTLMRVIAGQREPDKGAIYSPTGTRVCYLEQTPDMSKYRTLRDFVKQNLVEDEYYRIDMMQDLLGVNLNL